MKHHPKIDDLISNLNLVAASMNYEPLPISQANELIDHILYKGVYNGQQGKDGWATFEEGLITKAELQNLFIAHAATKISSFNNKAEPVPQSYLSTSLAIKISLALFGPSKNA